MKIDTQYFVKTATLASEEELSAALKKRCDVIEIAGEHPDFGIVRPVKISWRAYLQDKSEKYSYVKSHKLRKNVEKWIKELSNNNLSFKVERELKNESFLKWYKVYAAVMGIKDRLNMHIDESWLKSKQEQDKKTWGLFLYHRNKLIGGNIGSYGKEMLLVGYGAVRQVPEINWNLGALVDISTIEFGRELAFKTVSFGKDTNFYGLYLSPGLFSYKCRLGLVPEYVAKSGYVTTKVVSFEHLSDPVVLLTKKGSKLVTTVITQNNDIIPKEYEANGVEEVNIVKFTGN